MGHLFLAENFVLRRLAWAALVVQISGCTFGMGAMAPGVDEYVFITDIDHEERTDSSGRKYWVETDYFDSARMDWGVSFAGRTGISLLSMKGAERSAIGPAFGAEVEIRVCTSDNLCFGVDAGLIDQGSSFVHHLTDVNGLPYESEYSVALQGWGVVPQVQVMIRHPFWIEAGVGGAKVSVERGEGGNFVDSEPGWHPQWSAGIGVAFTRSLGLRLNYSLISASGVVDGQPLEPTASAWTLQFLID